jgi:hypothetical protein
MPKPYNLCPDCGSDWTAHEAYIARQERLCVAHLLKDGRHFYLRSYYTDQNLLDYVDAYEGDLFVCRKRGNRAVALCKQAITRRILADKGELPMPAPTHTPANFVNDIGDDW